MAKKHIATLRGLRYIYIIECDGRFKVGVAADPSARLAALQVSSPFRLYLRAVFPCPGREAVKIERNAHRLLAAYRLLGEWFACSFEQGETAVNRSFLRLGVPALTVQDISERLGAIYLADDAKRSKVGKVVARHLVGGMTALSARIG